MSIEIREGQVIIEAKSKQKQQLFLEKKPIVHKIVDYCPKRNLFLLTTNVQAPWPMISEYWQK